jgi:hypothetical protein
MRHSSKEEKEVIMIFYFGVMDRTKLLLLPSKRVYIIENVLVE